MGYGTQNGITGSPPRTMGVYSSSDPSPSSYPNHNRYGSDTASTSSGSSSPRSGTSSLSDSGEWERVSSGSRLSSEIALDTSSDVVATVRLLVKGFWRDKFDATLKISLPAYFARYVTGTAVTRDDIQAVLPFLRKQIIALRAEALGKEDKNLYERPFYISLDKQGWSTGSTPINLASFVYLGAARAMYNYANDTLEKKTLPPHSMVISDCEVKRYQYATPLVGSGGLEWIDWDNGKGVFCQLKKKYLESLTFWEQRVAHDSDNPLTAITSMLSRGKLENLQSLALVPSKKCLPYVSSGELSLSASDVNQVIVLDAIYRAGLKVSYLPNLQNLSLVFYTDKVTKTGLEALEAKYASLSSLTVHDIYSTMKRITSSETSPTYYVSGYDYSGNRYSQTTGGYTTYSYSLADSDNPNAKTLYGVLKEKQHESRLRSLQVYTWQATGTKRDEVGELVNDYRPPVSDVELLTRVVSEGLLSQYDTVEFRRHPDYLDAYEAILDTEAYKQAIHAAVAAKQIKPIRIMHLLEPEKTGYQAWVKDLSEGKFAELEEFSYAIPEQQSEENSDTYRERVIGILNEIGTAISDKKLTKLKKVIIEGGDSSFRPLTDLIERMVA